MAARPGRLDNPGRVEQHVHDSIRVLERLREAAPKAFQQERGIRFPINVAAVPTRRPQTSNDRNEIGFRHQSEIQLRRFNRYGYNLVDIPATRLNPVI